MTSSWTAGVQTRIAEAPPSAEDCCQYKGLFNSPNDNGFVLVGEYRNGELRTVGSTVPGWLRELREYPEK